MQVAGPSASLDVRQLSAPTCPSVAGLVAVSAQQDPTATATGWLSGRYEVLGSMPARSSTSASSRPLLRATMSVSPGGYERSTTPVVPWHPYCGRILWVIQSQRDDQRGGE